MSAPVTDRARGRLRAAVVALSIGFLIVLIRVLILTFSDAYKVETKPAVIRGQFLDRRGIPLASTEEASAIGVSPRDVHDPDFTAEELAARLDMSADEIIEKIASNKDRKYFLLKRQVDNVTADQVADLRLPGVYRQAEFRRVFPGGTLASNLLGFVGRDQVGLDGLERLFGYTLMKTPNDEPGTGPSITLTIDALMQHRMEKAIGDVFDQSNAKRATGLLMDVQTGEVLALVNFPNFDPNEYHKSAPFQRGNWALTLNYEPGSTIKIFMAGILLAEQAATLNDKFLCDGEVFFYNTSVRCKSQNRIVHHGELTLPEIIQKSCNVGIIKAMQRIRKDRLHYYMHGLGFGQKTGVLPQGTWETPGYLPEVKGWVPSTGFYMPIGQGFSITPLQLLRAAASLGNGGRLLRPQIIKKISYDAGKTYDEMKVESREGPFSPEVSRAVLAMMRRVVSSGTGRSADLPDMPIAGKTGTGQKSSAQGYAEKYVASFVGLFPAEEPRYAALVLFDEAGNHESGGSIAAPVFARAVQSILPLIKDTPVTVRKLPVLPLRPPHADPARLFDFSGLSAREAQTIVANVYKVSIEFRGSGYVYRQSPAPGTPAEGISKIILYLGMSE